MPSITLPAVIPVNAPAGMSPTIATGRYYEDDIITEPYRYENGLLHPPVGPGLGVQLDDERLQAYRLDR
jgi:muconate cycloisomerase